MKKSFFKSTLASSLLMAGVAAFAQSSLENPSPNSYQSGIGIISGWACNATGSQVEVLIDPVRGKPCRSGQGQERGRQSRPGGLDWF